MNNQLSNQLNNNQVIVLKSSISEADYTEIKTLQHICNSHDKTKLKLELDYKRSIRDNTKANEITEFLYYIDGLLVAYLGICCFGGKANELNGMVHPDHRRNGYFTRLFHLAILECLKDSKRQILLLSDGECESGKHFIESIHGKYSFSEYRMKQLQREIINPNPLISLRDSSQNDFNEIAHQNAVYFNTLDDLDQTQNTDSETTSFHNTTFIIELEGNVIGKICVDFSENSAFIFGFGIKPEYRGKGYGRGALLATLNLIHNRNIAKVELDVECKNDTALNLYKSCGFVEQSVMNYYEYTGKEL
jgi:predicted acetyltransferase